MEVWGDAADWVTLLAMVDDLRLLAKSEEEIQLTYAQRLKRRVRQVGAWAPGASCQWGASSCPLTPAWSSSQPCRAGTRKKRCPTAACESLDDALGGQRPAVLQIAQQPDTPEQERFTRRSCPCSGGMRGRVPSVQGPAPSFS